MATLAPDFQIQPRTSAETDRRYLLADSVAPSESASMVNFGDGDVTPRAHSPAPPAAAESSSDPIQPVQDAGRFRIPAGPSSHERRDTIADPSPRPYRGFPSEAHYLAALRAWAESKKYTDSGEHGLIGFYGHKTVDDYTSGPKMEGLGLKKKWKARKEKKNMDRRNTVT